MPLLSEMSDATIEESTPSTIPFSRRNRSACSSVGQGRSAKGGSTQSSAVSPSGLTLTSISA